ncbi:MAG: UDP-N-acetylmuramate dehydrogenase [Chloroflexi bacterium]|nr:MAG: UDP-N-acetylmuramate dehydrogenase [Chloroflexota bacterium]
MPTDLDRLFIDLSIRFDNRPRRNEPLAQHTTFRIGGPADIWLTVEHVDELADAVLLARRRGVPVFILGTGANILVGDGGIRGLVIENRAGEVQFPPLEGLAPGAEVLLTADSGVNLPGLARRCARRGLRGLEWAAGIPGTIGGAVVNNAGAYGSDMAHTLYRVELLSPSGTRVWQPVEWLEYGYRTSRLKRSAGGEWVVLRAELRLVGDTPANVEARLAELNERRKASQPPGATVGSMFKNPPGDYAGRLIEAAGLKGLRQGGAQISPVHANFFQNLGDATCRDVLVLIHTAQTRVRKLFGVELELEIELVGEMEP